MYAGLTGAAQRPAASAKPAAQQSSADQFDLPPLVILRCRRDPPLAEPRNRLLHRHSAGVEVDVIPAQRARLAATYAGGGQELPKRMPAALHRLQKSGRLGSGPSGVPHFAVPLGHLLRPITALTKITRSTPASAIARRSTARANSKVRTLVGLPPYRGARGPPSTHPTGSARAGAPCRRRSPASGIRSAASRCFTSGVTDVACT
jgi:hypothetical protein